jgi:hypothetical protein
MGNVALLFQLTHSLVKSQVIAHWAAPKALPLEAPRAKPIITALPHPQSPYGSAC